MWVWMILGGIGVIVVASAFRMPGLNDTRGRLRGVLAWIYIVFGGVHITEPLRFLPIMPPIIPHGEGVVIFTGVCEILGGIGLLLPATRRWAGIALAVYAVCVYPANLYHAFGHVVVEGLPSSWWYHGPRLLFQPVIVWWALFSGNVISWPFLPDRPDFTRAPGAGLAGAGLAGDSAAPDDQSGPSVPVNAPIDAKAPR